MMPNNEQLKTYKSLSLQEIVIPQRSDLYSLEPLGIGTPLSESLTSYISRLAEAHCVSLGELCLNAISPLLKRCSSSDARSRSIDRLINSRTALKTLNGRGKSAFTMVEAIEKLTLRKQLNLLTLLNWSNVLSDKGLLRETKAWCAICLQSWYEEDKLIYEPLAWSLSVVRLCHIHEIPLQVLCPNCHQQSQHLRWKTQLGHCSKCQQWLGDKSEPVVSDAECEDELKINLWTAKNIGIVISYMPFLSHSASREGVTNSICVCVEALGGTASFAKIFERSRTTVDRYFPELGKKISKRYSEYNTQKRREKLGLKIELLIEANEDPPPSLQEVCKRISANNSTLYILFPDLCELVTTRYKLYLNLRKKERFDNIYQQVRQATIELHEKGIKPISSRVSRLLDKPGLLRERDVVSALIKIQRELGYRE